MNRPWMQFHTRDWLDSKELRRCSPTARAILSDLMCLAHEGEPYGYLADKLGALTIKYMASRCVVSTGQFLKALAELQSHERVKAAESGVLYVPRMVEDEDIRVRRAAGGKLSIGHPNTPPPRHGEGTPEGTHEGYPSGHPSLEIDSRGRTRADSGSGSSVLEFQRKQEAPKPKKAESPSRRFAEFWSIYPVKENRPITEGVFFSLVSTDNEGAVFDCLRRYLESDRGARSPKNPANWLHDCARDEWACEWPKARDSPVQPQGTAYKLVSYDSEGNLHG